MRASLRFLVASLSSVILLASSSAILSVQAGHTLPKDVGGDCWRPGTPLWCRTSWAAAPYHETRLRIIEQFSDLESGWVNEAQTACNDWHNYRLPGNPHQGEILCHWGTAIFQDSIVYEKWANPALPSGTLAVTFNCNTSNFCSKSANQAMNVWYSEIHLNRSEIFWLSDTQKSWTFAHEMGHTLGLWHHSGDYVMNPTPNNNTGPTSTDYGRLPPCSGAYTTFGVRCVFNITN